MALRFTPELIEEVKARADIVAIVSEHVALRRSGKNYVGLCPFHAEKTPSFTVSPDKQMFHCFGCQAGGDVITFVMRITGSDFPTAMERLARRVGVDVSRYVASPDELERMRERQRLQEALRLAAVFFANMLRSRAGQAARAYLQYRGVSPASVQRFQLGYAPPGDALRRFLQERGIDDKVAIAAGLLVQGQEGKAPYPRFRDRLMFPIWDHTGRIVGFGGRLLGDGGSGPKYLNSPETALFSKRNVLYGLHLAAKAARESGTVIIVEGYMDCISLHQHGIENVVASLGTAFTEQQARMLSRVAERAVIAFDADAAGEAATLRSLDLLAACGLRVGVASLPQGYDPDELVRGHGPEWFRELVGTAVPLTEYKLNKVFAEESLATVEGRARAVQRAAAILARLESAVEREGYIQFIAERCGVTPEAVRADLRRAQRAVVGGYGHSAEKKRHNNKGFPRRDNEQTRHSGRGGGDLLFYAEQVILRHVLTDVKRTPYLAALDVPGEWSGETTARAAALLRGRPAGVDTEQWLQSLPESAAAMLLRTLWADESMADVPWDDAWRELQRQRGRRKLAQLADRLDALMNSADPLKAPGMLAELLVEYKRLRSMFGELVQR